MKQRTHHIILGLILAVGFLLRFIASATHSYSSDELSAITRLNYDSFSDLIEFGVKTGDMHPAGVQIFMKFWSMLVGTSEIAMRLPFVVLGTLSIFLIYKIGKRWSVETGLLGAGLWSVLLFPIIQSELARPYSPGLFFTLLTAFFLLRFLFNPLTKKQYWQNGLLLCVSLFGAMVTHYFAFLTVGFMALSALLFIPKKAVIPYLSAGILACLLFIPHLSITVYQTSIEDGLQWLAPPGTWWLFEFLAFSFNDSWLLISCMVVTVITAFVFTGFSTRQNISKSSILLLIWFFGTYIVGHLLSHLFTPILKFPVMVFVLPFFILSLAQIISPLLQQKKQILLIALVAITFLSTTIEKHLFKSIHFEVFKELSDHIRSWESKLGKNQMTKVVNISNPNYLNFYARQTGEEFNLAIDMLDYGDAEKLDTALKYSNKTYLAIGYSGRHTPVQFLNQSLKYFPNLVDYYQYNNSAIFLLSKQPDDSQKQFEILDSYSFMTNSSLWQFEQAQFDTITKQYFADSTGIYSPELTLAVNAEMAENRAFVKVNVKGIASHANQISIVAIPENKKGETVKDNDGTPIWMGLDIETDLEMRQFGAFAFSLPPNMPPDGFVKIYIWNRNKKSFIIKEIQVDVVRNIWNN